MILYVDGEGLLRLFVRWDGFLELRERVEAAAVVATSVMSYAEVVSAAAALYRRSAITAREQSLLRSELDRDWPRLLKLEVTETVWRRAADLAASYGLSALDGAHLASFLMLVNVQPADDTSFWSPSERMRLAAQAALAAQRGS